MEQVLRVAPTLWAKATPTTVLDASASAPSCCLGVAAKTTALIGRYAVAKRGSSRFSNAIAFGGGSQFMATPGRLDRPIAGASRNVVRDGQRLE